MVVVFFTMIDPVISNKIYLIGKNVFFFPVDPSLPYLAGCKRCRHGKIFLLDYYIAKSTCIYVNLSTKITVCIHAWLIQCR